MAAAYSVLSFCITCFCHYVRSEYLKNMRGMSQYIKETLNERIKPTKRSGYTAILYEITQNVKSSWRIDDYSRFLCAYTKNRPLNSTVRIFFSKELSLTSLKPQSSDSLEAATQCIFFLFATSVKISKLLTCLLKL